MSGQERLWHRLSRHQTGRFNTLFPVYETGEVGLIVETMGGDETEVGGTMPQRIASCMEALGALMALPHAVGASMVLADKRRTKAAGGQQDLVHQVANILGVGRYFYCNGSGVTLEYTSI